MVPYFIGISLPATLTSRITPLLHGIPHVEWAEAETLHVQLALLRAQDQGPIREWIQFFEELGPSSFELKLSGMQFLSAKKGRGQIQLMTAPNPSLDQLQQLMTDAAEKVPDGLTFTLLSPPCVRLGTAGKASPHHLMDYMKTNAYFESLPFTVDEVWVYTERRSPKRTLVEPVVAIPFTPEPKEEKASPPPAPKSSGSKKSFLPHRPFPKLSALF